MGKKTVTMCVIFCMAISLLTGCSENNIDESEVVASISDVYSDENGDITMELIDGRTFDLGNLKGEDGKDGLDGQDGIDGEDGQDGKNGVNGTDGADGSNGSSGSSGRDGRDGKDGKDGISIVDVAINSDQHLIVTLSDGTTKDAGYIMGTDDSGSSDTPDEPDEPDVPTEQEVAAILQFDSTGTRVIGCTNWDEATYLEVPEGVTFITPGLFEDAKQLERVVLPESYTEIADQLFWKCTNLKEVKLSPKTTIIGKQAFRECLSLSHINIPDTVTKIGSYAFVGCSSLEYVNLSGLTTDIGESTFYSCGLKTLEIPGTVKNIGRVAFANNEKLETIIFNEGLESMALGAFQNNRSLKEIILPSTYKKETDGSVFSDCSSLEKVYVLGDSVPSFNGCYAIKELHLTDRVTNIEDYALKDCFDVTIYAPAGSYAETYAAEHGIPFVAE